MTAPDPRTFVALLRGINVGGHNAVPMAALRTSLADAGLADVRTYIASGNVVLRAAEDDGAPATREHVAEVVSRTLRDRLGVTTSVLVRSAAEVVGIAAGIPEPWVDDPTLRAEVLYLFDDVDEPDVVDRLPLAAGIDVARYTPGAVLWAIPRAQVRRSGLPRIIGTPLYARITMRNIRTARRLAAMVAEG